MSSSGVLIEDAASAFSLPISTLLAHMQILRKNGLIQKGARGVNAVSMEAADGAALLTSLLSSPTFAAADKATTAALIRPQIARCAVNRVTGKLLEKENCDFLVALDDHAEMLTFGEMLKHILISAQGFLNNDNRDSDEWRHLFVRVNDPPSIRITHCHPFDMVFVDLLKNKNVDNRFIYGDLPIGDFRHLVGRPSDVYAKFFKNHFICTRSIATPHIIAIAESLQKPVR